MNVQDVLLALWRGGELQILRPSETWAPNNRDGYRLARSKTWV